VTEKKKPDPTIDERILAALDGQRVEDRLFVLGIRRSVFLQHYSNGEVRKFVGFLNREVFPDLLGTLEKRLARIDARGFDTGLGTTQRLKDLAVELRGVLGGGIKAGSATLRDEMKRFAVSEAKWQQATLQANIPLQVEIGGANVAMLKAIVDARPFAGGFLKDWSEGLSRAAVDRVSRAVNVGLAQGETSEQIVRRVRGTAAAGYADGAIEATRSEAAMVVRTAVSHVSAHAREEVGKANADLVKGKKWTATLDPKTCLRCAVMDGQVFPLGEGPRPPLHPRCRCDTVDELKSWKELGINLKEIPEGQRASFNGPVRESMTFEEWFDEQPAAMQKRIVGPARYALLKDKSFGLGEFLSQQGRILTLDELDEATS
jgi:SPP1 gp7 family putative phage head morphogenesis protein